MQSLVLKCRSPGACEEVPCEGYQVSIWKFLAKSSMFLFRSSLLSLPCVYLGFLGKSSICQLKIFVFSIPCVKNFLALRVRCRTALN